MVIVARFAGRCPVCRGPISIGDRIRWERGQPTVHEECIGLTRVEVDYPIRENAPITVENRPFWVKQVRKEGRRYVGLCRAPQGLELMFWRKGTVTNETTV